MKRKLMLLLACIFTGISLVTAQTSTVSGIVTSEEDGEPIAGASVLVKGTSLGTVTDIDGKFSITNVPGSAKVLSVSFIGMQSQEVAVKHGLVYVALKPNTEVLDEVMVVAFGTQKKSSFTGSAAVIDSETLSRKIASNVTTTLAGAVPGLQLRGTSGAPGAGNSSINIRGIASLYAATDPLIIVDGAPYSASLTNIPTEDIESITVLKDAASAALYGARGAAGVIIVTTKRGKAQNAQVSVDMKWGVNSRAIQDYETINDPAKYYETVYGEYYNDYYYSQGLSAAAANAKANETMLDHLGYNIYTVPENEYLIGQDGRINPKATLGRSYKYGDETYYLINDNWRDEAYSNSLRQEYSVNINGAINNKGNYYVSLGYLDDDGIIENSGFERITARVKADYQAKDWLKVGANIGYVNSVTESTANMGTSLNSVNLMYYTSMIAPIYPIYVRTLDANGNPQIRTDENGNQQFDYGVAATNYPGNQRAFMATGNPLSDLRYNKNESKRNQFNGSFYADVNLADCLKFNATSTLNWGHTNYSMFENMLYGAKVSAGGQVYKSQTDAFRQNHTQTLSYFDRFGLHNVNAMIGHEYYDTKTTYLYAEATGLFSPEIPEIDAAGRKTTSNSYTSEYNVEGFFGNLQYNYDEKYFASASFRRDASSRFAKENRWGNFWSVGAAWLINKEDFFNAPWVDELKLKVSIGQQGNDNIGNWSYTDLYSLTQADGKMSASFAQVGNPDITWETTTNANVGLEFSLFKNRLNGSIDYYNKKTTDLLFWLSIPESAGSRGYYGNIGDIRNSGVELTLNGSVIRTNNVDWSLQFNISHNRDEILKLPDSKVADLGGFTEDWKWYKVGGHIYNYFLPQYAGTDEQGQALYWVDADLGEAETNRPGKKHDFTTTNPNNATKYELGNSLPDAFGGFGTTLAAYGFDVSLAFDYQIGGQIYDSRYASLMSNIVSANSAGNAIHVDALKSWTPNNTQSSIPRFQYGDQYTVARCDRFMTDASYLNFQSFSIGYTLPKDILGSLGISRLRIYATGENLCFWSARKGLDPRYAYSENESVNVYSPVRTIMGGLQVTF